MKFTDSLSEYKNNSALFGGAISCTSCRLYMSENKYSYNMAKEAGTILADSIATVYLEYDILEYNTALQNGGGMIIMTRSSFYLNHVKFRYNYA